MPQKKFTVILLPDDDCYQVFFPHYPDCITFGASVPEALQRAQEALELTLKSHADEGRDPVPENAWAAHVVVADIVAEVPESLIEETADTPVETDLAVKLV